MKIFIVSRGVPSKKNVTLGIFEFDQAKALSEAGHDVVMLSIDLRSIRRKRSWGMRSYVQEGIRVEEMNLPIGAVPKSLLIKIGTPALKKLLKVAISKYGEPDIVHSHFYDISYMTKNALAGRYKHVITEHSSLINSEISAGQIRKYGSMYAKADLVIGVSGAFCRRMDSLFGINTICINNIVDTDIFKIKSHGREGDSSKPFKFITVANLTANKNVELVVEGFSNLVKKGKNVELIIVGDGKRRAYIESRVEKLGIGKQVKMLGKVDREKICRSLSMADCFVLTSNSETFGLAYIEAIASGLPVIATKCGGPEDFVTEENGLLISRNNMDELVESMIYMYDNAQNYDSEKMSNEISHRFCAENIAEKIIEAYKSIAK